MAVGAEVWVDIADVHPPGAGLGVVLPYQLVEGQVVADIVKPLAALLQVATDAKVGGLALHVLAVVNAAHGLVERLAAESGAYRDGFAHRHAQGFQYVFGQIGEVYLLLCRWFVVDAQLGGCLAAIKTDTHKTESTIPVINRCLFQTGLSRRIRIKPHRPFRTVSTIMHRNTIFSQVCTLVRPKSDTAAGAPSPFPNKGKNIRPAVKRSRALLVKDMVFPANACFSFSAMVMISSGQISSSIETEK